jgi:hypothetical protein
MERGRQPNGSQRRTELPFSPTRNGNRSVGESPIKDGIMGRLCIAPAGLKSINARCVIAIAGCCLLLLASAGSSYAQEWQTARAPLGVYAHVDIEFAVQLYLDSLQPRQEAGTCSALPNTIKPQQVHDSLRGTYTAFLADDAVSGISAGVHWCAIQVADTICVSNHSCPPGLPDGYDWSYLDDVFAVANGMHKSVRLLVTPAVDAPSWLMAKLPSCDTLFIGQAAGEDCGKVTFSAFPESQRADSHELPLPWDRTYNSAWEDFLKQLNARYGSNSAFVAIVVAGPVCASTEIILPTSANGSYLNVASIPPFHPNLAPIKADKMWHALIDNRFPHNDTYKDYPDQVFVDYWKKTIETYEHIFSNVTLTISPDLGDDLPELGKLSAQHETSPLWKADCAWNQTVSCEAKTQILADFVAARGPNAKATDVGGLAASSVVTPGDLGLPGVKVLTSMPQWPPFLGGAEFDHSVTGSKEVRKHEGCPDPAHCKLPTPVEATVNVLKVLFYGTPVGDIYGGERGAASIRYVDLDYRDIEYARALPFQCAVPASGNLGETSMQDVLNRASHDLFNMAGMSTILPVSTCPAAR